MNGKACGLECHTLAFIRVLSLFQYFCSHRKSFAALKSQANVISLILATSFIFAPAFVLNSTMWSDGDLSYTGHVLGETADTFTPGIEETESGTSAQVPQAQDSSASISPQISETPQENPSASNAPDTASQPESDSTGESVSSDANTSVLEQKADATDAITNSSGLQNPANETPVSAESLAAEIMGTNTQAPENITPPLSAPAPKIELGISIPSDITRGESFSLIATIANKGEGVAKHVVLEILLPAGTNILEENPSEIGIIKAGESIEAKFTVQTSYGLSLGANKILARVTYE